MKLSLLASCALACLALAGCSTVGGSSEVSSAIKEIASDPRCGHTDRITGNIGGLGSNSLNLFLERTCPPAGAPPGDSSQVPKP